MDLTRVWVTAKSPLLRIHGNALFLTEIQDGSSPDSKHFVLARGDEATSFYSNLIVGSCYDIENVTPTTITKGTDRPRKILLLSAFSKIISCKNADMSMETNIPAIKGTVTKCIDKTLGIYELSSNKRLYLTYQYDGKSHLPSIPVGSGVTIHNAHVICTSDRESELGSDCENIVCCMRTSVKIGGKIKQQQPPKEKSGDVQRILLPLCGKLFPSLTVLEWLRHQAISLLLQKLVPDVLKLKEMLPVLVQLLTTKMTSNDLPIIRERKRNPYEDFLSHEKACLFSQSRGEISKIAPCTFPKAIELADHLESTPRDGSGCITSLHKSGWTCSMLRSCDKQPHMVLVAKLCCNGTDGRLCLTDATGSIPCTLSKILPPTKCAKACNESYKGDRTERTERTADEPTSSISRCFPQPCLNHLLRIDVFVVIRESRTSSNSSERNKETSEIDIEGGSKDISGSKVNVYVMFDPRNATCLYRGTERAASPGCIRPRRRKRSSTSLEGSPPESVNSKTFMLRSRRQLLREHRDKSKVGSAMPSFYCDILILDSYHPKKAKRDVVPIQGDGDGERNMDGRAGKQDERMDDGKAALLCFHGDAVRWYNFLREGRLYKMDYKNEDMQTHVVPSVMKLSKKGMTQPVYIITDFTQLQALQDSTHLGSLQTINSDTSLSHKGKQRQQPKLSSISGLITRKTVKSSSMEEAHTSRQETSAQISSVHLEVQDIATQSTVTVKVPTHIHDDMLGLVPGATVSMRNCLMKIDPGIAVTYDIGPLTSIQVDSFCTKSFSEIAINPDTHHSTHQSLDVRSLPTMKQRAFLYHMIQDTSKDPTHISWVYAHTTLITKLVLRWICNHCGRNECKCADTRRQGGKLITQIMLAVDDGTGECLIWSNRSNVVSAVLGLTPRQWTILEDSCTGPNKQLVYRKWAKGQKEEYDWEAASDSGPRRSRLVLAVSKLCQHFSVQRSLWFKTRRFRESTKEVSSDREKSAWPAGLVLCCEEVSS